MTWTTPDEIREQVEVLWNRGRLLSAAVEAGRSCYPLRLRLRRPAVAELATRFDDVRTWIRALEAGSKAARGFGYDIAWRVSRHRQLGRNRVPSSVSINTELDALRMIGREKDAERFRALAAVTVAEFPPLVSWLARYPLVVLEHSADWERVLAVLRWFRDHPKSGLYLRQLDISGVDSKFIEARLGLLAPLLDRVLPEEAIEARFTGARQFEARYGLRSKPALVRFRMLDDRWRMSGFSDVTVTAQEFAHPDFARAIAGVRRVFVTENETNGLTFPAVPDSMVVFGLGYGVELLIRCQWLASRDVYYWGDLDTHGFAMLDRLRAVFPSVNSFLMNRETLLAHRALWVQEGEPFAKALTHLTAEELALFDALRSGEWGERVRLEQERVGFPCVERAVEAIVARGS